MLYLGPACATIFDVVALNPLIRLAVLLFALVFTVAARAEVVIPLESSWKMLKGVQEASAPDTSAWRALTFNDAEWTTSSARFFYGVNITGGTPLGDMRNGYTSIYLRKTFEIRSVADLADLDLDVINDDGFVAWINGKLVAQKNPPSGTIRFNSVAGGFAEDPAELITYNVENIAATLVDGENILAIQAFNADISSSDFQIDAQLISTLKPSVAPLVAQVTPMPGPVTKLTNVTVRFSMVVQGVDGSDLLVNGFPASAVSGSGTTYTFSFNQPPFGPVQFAWSRSANIRTIATIPVAFDPYGANASFIFDLENPAPLTIVNRHPLAASTVAVLNAVEIEFSKPVFGISQADLLINGVSATNFTGAGKGPYTFSFATPAAGSVQFSWASNHGITDGNTAPIPLTDTSAWNVIYNPASTFYPFRLSEILADAEAPPKQDWIEIVNPSRGSVSLEGWSLSDNPEDPGKWVFPKVTIPASGRILVLASGNDIREPANLQANFKLSTGGEYLGLYSADSPRKLVDFFNYPEQRHGISYGVDSSGKPGYFEVPTPLAANGAATITNVVEEVHFSVVRGVFTEPFSLSLATPTAGASIRYTLDGSEPTLTTGFAYTGLIRISTSSVVRATGFKPGHLSSIPITHTYLFNLSGVQAALPVVSLATATNNLFGPTGIMEVEPRNTDKHGIAWERPVSMELIELDNSGFQINGGLRVAGGDYIRALYDYRDPTSDFHKYAYRVAFRGDYGDGKLRYPFIPGLSHEIFDAIQFRSGTYWDPIQLTDPLAHRLQADMGHVASLGRYVSLFLNGKYLGYYNPAERVDEDFMQNWYASTNQWDVIYAYNEVINGDDVEWIKFTSYTTEHENVAGRPFKNDAANPAVYQQIEQQMDMVNFIDYLLLNIYGNTDDWPHNNVRSARERIPGAKWTFYSWDAEFSFGLGGIPEDRNTITNQLSNLNPPHGVSTFQELFLNLSKSSEFRALFADRVQKHMFNGGALTDPHIRMRYDELADVIRPAIPQFDNSIVPSWINERRRHVLDHLNQAGFYASSNAPIFSKFGGNVHKDYDLEISNEGGGIIYYTTDGTDPRVRFTGAVNPTATAYNGPIQLTRSIQINARTLANGKWSALVSASFNVGLLGIPLRITELMYNPPGGDGYEFIELVNAGGSPLNLDGIYFDGVTYVFPASTPDLAPGAYVVLANSANPPGFAQRYPNVTVAGYYKNNLSNAGETITVFDPAGNIITAVTYDDENGWPKSADGNGTSIEIIRHDLDSSSPGNWIGNGKQYGTPGVGPVIQIVSSPVQISELMAANLTSVQNGTNYPDWVEIRNTSDSAVSIGNWSLSDDSTPRKFVFPANFTLAANQHLVLWCDTAVADPGFHTGFALQEKGETVYLYNAAGQQVDVISYGLQVNDYSLARNADGDWILANPTPNAVNEAVYVEGPETLVINEVLPNALTGFSDWIELLNTNPTDPIEISGMYVGISNVVSRVPQHSFMLAGGFLQLFADEQPGNDHLSFKLPASGNKISIYGAGGEEIVHFDYPALGDNVSTGYFPDGSGNVILFPTTQSPGAKNFLPNYSGPMIHEVLAFNRSRSENGRIADWVELHNPLTTTFDLGGMKLSRSKTQAGTWAFPAGSLIAANAYIRVWFDAVAPISSTAPNFNTGTELNNVSGGVYLYDAAGAIVNSVEYGFQVADLSIGKSGGTFQLLATPTPVAANSGPATLAPVSNLRFNEWMVQPLQGDDWFELYNLANNPAQLSGLYITDNPSAYGKTNFVVGPLSFIGANSFVMLQADEELDRGSDHVSFRLDSFGETLRLYSPALVLVDEVNYLAQTAGVSEGRTPDGSNTISTFPNNPTPGASNVPALADTDGDGMPDQWEDAFGLLKNNPADAALDADGDGQRNLAEFLAGTSPKDANSALRLTGIQVAKVPTPRVILNFPAATGKSYTVQYRDRLDTDTVWLKLGNVDAQPSPTTVQVVDTNPDGSKRFYRVITPKIP